jgi:RNA polymerase sigma-70 factor, ECF subfamily
MSVFSTSEHRADDLPRRVSADSPDDIEVVARVLGGERALFELLMRRHNQRLFRAARAIVRSDDEAEDVMQEAYVRAYTHLAQFEARAKFSTWLTRIAVHEALARARKQRRELDMEEDDDISAEQASPEEALSGRELGAILEPLVDALPAAFRLVFVLRAVEGLTVEETAECLELLPETVRTRFFRARKLLQKALRERAALAQEGLYAFHARRCDRVVASVLARLLGDAH